MNQIKYATKRAHDPPRPHAQDRGKESTLADEQEDLISIRSTTAIPLPSYVTDYRISLAITQKRLRDGTLVQHSRRSPPVANSTPSSDESPQAKIRGKTSSGLGHLAQPESHPELHRDADAGTQSNMSIAARNRQHPRSTRQSREVARSRNLLSSSRGEPEDGGEGSVVLGSSGEGDDDYGPAASPDESASEGQELSRPPKRARRVLYEADTSHVPDYGKLSDAQVGHEQHSRPIDKELVPREHSRKTRKPQGLARGDFNSTVGTSLEEGITPHPCSSPTHSSSCAPESPADQPNALDANSWGNQASPETVGKHASVEVQPPVKAHRERFAALGKLPAVSQPFKTASGTEAQSAKDKSTEPEPLTGEHEDANSGRETSLAISSIVSPGRRREQATASGSSSLPVTAWQAVLKAFPHIKDSIPRHARERATVAFLAGQPAIEGALTVRKPDRRRTRLAWAFSLENGAKVTKKSRRRKLKSALAQAAGIKSEQVPVFHILAPPTAIFILSVTTA